MPAEDLVEGPGAARPLALAPVQPGLGLPPQVAVGPTQALKLHDVVLQKREDVAGDRFVDLWLHHPPGDGKVDDVADPIAPITREPLEQRVCHSREGSPARPTAFLVRRPPVS